MKMLDHVKAKGEVSFILTDKEGNVKLNKTENLVTYVGCAYIAKRMYDNTTTIANYIEVGTSSASSSDKAQTTLVTPVINSRVTCSSIATTTKTTANDSTQYTATFPAGIGTGALVEAGLFNAVSGGTMVARTTFAVINKGTDDSLTIVWRITIS